MSVSSPALLVTQNFVTVLKSMTIPNRWSGTSITIGQRRQTISDILRNVTRAIGLVSFGQSQRMQCTIAESDSDKVEPFR